MSHEDPKVVADRVQSRIIREKLAKGKPLFPDEEKLLMTAEVNPVFFEEACVMLETHATFQALLNDSEQRELSQKVARIQLFVQRIQRYFTENGLVSEFDQVRALDVIEEWKSGLNSLERVGAFHIATKQRTMQDFVKLLLVRMVEDCSSKN